MRTKCGQFQLTSIFLPAVGKCACCLSLLAQSVRQCACAGCVAAKFRERTSRLHAELRSRGAPNVFISARRGPVNFVAQRGCKDAPEVKKRLDDGVDRIANAVGNPEQGAARANGRTTGSCFPKPRTVARRPLSPPTSQMGSRPLQKISKLDSSTPSSPPFARQAGNLRRGNSCPAKATRRRAARIFACRSPSPLSSSWKLN